MTTVPALHGLLAEFDQADGVLHATQQAYGAGYRRMDAYTPFPVEGLSESLGFRRTRLPLLTLAGGIIGCISAFAMMYYPNVISYPMNIGGRPHNSWPAWVPIMFELTVLGAALFSVFGMLALNGLPQPYHPVFNVPEFKLATMDRFFLCIESRDPQFNLAETRRFLEQQHPQRIFEVPR